MKKLLLIFCLFICIPNLTSAISISEDKITIMSGDTFCLPAKDEIDHGGRITKAGNLTHRFRLYGVQTPNVSQPYGDRAIMILSKILEHKKDIDFVPIRHKGKRETFVKAKIKNTDIATILVGNGLAWVKGCGSDQYCIELEKLELAAQERKIGLWADTHPVKPWVWRARKKFTGSGYSIIPFIETEQEESVVKEENTSPDLHVEYKRDMNKAEYAFNADFNLQEFENFIYTVKVATRGKLRCKSVEAVGDTVNLHTSRFVIALKRKEIIEIRRERI